MLAARVGNDESRPLLAGDPSGALARLSALREEAYTAAADASVDTEDRDVDVVADAVLAAFEDAVMSRTVGSTLGPRSYDVVIENSYDALGARCAAGAGSRSYRRPRWASTSARSSVPRSAARVPHERS